MSHDRPPGSSGRLQISRGETDSGVRAPTEGSKEDEGEVAVFQMIDEKSQKRGDRGVGVEVLAFGIAFSWGRSGAVGEVAARGETRIWTRTPRGGGRKVTARAYRPLPAQTSMRAAKKVTKTGLSKATMATKRVSNSIQSRTTHSYA